MIRCEYLRQTGALRLQGYRPLFDLICVKYKLRCIYIIKLYYSCINIANSRYAMVVNICQIEGRR